MFINYKVTPENLPNRGILHVNHQKNLRSGHVAHALVEYKKDCVMSFYSNCSGTRNSGHNGFGWMEYKCSTDGGRTWGEARVLEYSYDAFINQPFTISCISAVSTKENEIIVFCQRNLNPNGWEPFLEPVVLKSEDGGDTWSEPVELCDKKARIYDAIVHDGVIYVLTIDTGWQIEKPEDGYYLYKSEDSGNTFSLVSRVPAFVDNAYGNLEVMDDGALICYFYDENDEYHMDYHISYDMGVTWTKEGKSFVAKRIRNPQVCKVNGGYILHGRSGSPTPELQPHFVLYTSKDGIHWDEGVYMCTAKSRGCYYSNNLVMNQEDGSQRVLIQASLSYDPYDDSSRVNIVHWLLDIV